jgi:vacuolar protein sorting-associated protein 35
MPVQDIVGLHTTVLNLAVKCYPDQLEYVDKIFEITEAIFSNMNLDHIQFNSPVSKELIKMLKIPIDMHKNVLILLKIKNYSTLLDHLDYPGRKSLCQYILNSALENETIISTPDEVDGLLQLLTPVIVESSDKPHDYEEDTEDFIDEQTLVARLIHLMRSENLDEQFIILNAARKQFGNSGKERIKYTLPPIIFSAYELAARYKAAASDDDKWEKKCDKIFKFCFQTINALIKAELPAELPFRIFLQGSIALCQINYENCENITYEFISQAIALYDEEIATNKYSAITLIIGTCQKILHVFEEENCDSLRQNCVTRAAKLLKKPDQCRAVGLCSNLFWNCQDRADGTSLKDGKKVNECLRKCLKIAAQCVDINAQFELHVEILNYYMYYFGAKNDQVSFFVCLFW